MILYIYLKIIKKFFNSIARIDNKLQVLRKEYDDQQICYIMMWREEDSYRTQALDNERNLRNVYKTYGIPIIIDVEGLVAYAKNFQSCTEYIEELTIADTYDTFTNLRIKVTFIEKRKNKYHLHLKNIKEIYYK